MAPLLDRADVVVLPFRQVTTSGSAILALYHGKPLIVPDLAALADLPGRRCPLPRRRPGADRRAGQLARADDESWRPCRRPHAYAAAISWPDIARETTAAIAIVPGHPDGERGPADQSHPEGLVRWPSPFRHPPVSRLRGIVNDALYRGSSCLLSTR